tara:strand:+ start:596 stop:1075 length:480 start_codon:yes stop_codon:yes gene_type:complete
MTVSCIQPLLLSNVLPHDLVVHEIFGKHLCKLNSPLSEKQKESIQQGHFYFKKLLLMYYNTFDRHPDAEMYFLEMFDNDLLLAINEGKPFIFEQSDYLKQNPELTKLCMSTVPDEKLPDFIYSIWCFLSFEKKLEVYYYMTERLHIEVSQWDLVDYIDV